MTEPRGRDAPRVGASRPGRVAREWWQSRLGYRFIGEAAMMLSLYAVYKIVRYAVRNEAAQAFANARQIIGIERALRVFNEPDLQQLVLHHPSLVRLLNQYYLGVHFPITIAILVWLYARRPSAYRATRRVLVITTALGMGIHVLYPLAPPRMLPSFGFVDTGRLFGPSAYGTGATFNSLANQFAAMPSLHFGWAVIVTVAVVAYGRSRWRWVVVLHPIATAAAIVMTANHYWMDIIVAVALLGSVYAAVALVQRLRRAGEPTQRLRQAGEPTDAATGRDATVIDLRDEPDVTATSRPASPLGDLEPRVG